MKIWYYPGCTLKTPQGRALEEAALAALETLGVRAVELPEWNCCGAVHSLAQDDLIRQLAPVRMLKRTANLGGERLLTICSMCCNTLSRANLIMAKEPEKRKKINLFLDDSDDYQGQVEVVHLLTFLKEDIGWERIAEAVREPLDGLKVSPYYGCTLTRPGEVAVTRAGPEGLLEELLSALGAEVRPLAETELCCGSYQGVADPERAHRLTRRILTGAAKSEAQALALSCPLCHFNLATGQDRLAGPEVDPDLTRILYFTQLLAGALGVGRE